MVESNTFTFLTYEPGHSCYTYKLLKLIYVLTSIVRNQSVVGQNRGLMSMIMTVTKRMLVITLTDHVVRELKSATDLRNMRK